MLRHFDKVAHKCALNLTYKIFVIYIVYIRYLFIVYRTEDVTMFMAYLSHNDLLHTLACIHKRYSNFHQMSKYRHYDKDLVECCRDHLVKKFKNGMSKLNCNWTDI